MNNKLTNKFEKKLILDYPLGILEYPHWVDQSDIFRKKREFIEKIPILGGWVMSHYHVGWLGLVQMTPLSKCR